MLPSLKLLSEVRRKLILLRWLLSPQRLEADGSDDYLNADWADPTGLKKKFTGAGEISWRPK